MMQRFFYLIIASLATHSAFADVTNCTSGNLNNIITDKTVSELTISGTMNATDFRFVADSLSNLNSLDLSNVVIEGCNSDKPVFGNSRSFAGNTLPNSCFADSKATTIVLPTSLEVIGEGAFVNSSITAITLPESLDSIADYAFSACPDLQSIVIPAATKVIGNGAFAHCPSLTSASVSNGTDNLKIGDFAFLGCDALANVNLGKRTASIGKQAFSGCSNPNFAISLDEESELTEIGESAFLNSGLKTFDFTKCPNLKVIPQYAFATSQLQNIAIPSSIEHICEGAFFYSTSITAIDLGENDDSISDLQFAGCNSAENNGLTENTTEIGKYAYYGWGQQSKLIVPASVSYIGDYAFANMSNLAKVTSLNTTAPELGDSVFKGITPSNVLLTTKIQSEGYTTADQWKDFNFTLNGDASNNKEINVNDLTSIISYTLGKTPKTFLIEAADVNVDNTVNDTDIDETINLIMKTATTDRE